MNLLAKINGKKTYVIALAGLIWGLYQMDSETILIALGLFGLRHGIAVETKKLQHPLIIQTNPQTNIETVFDNTNQTVPEPVVNIPVEPENNQVYG